jgi:hypothetical protein
LVHFGVLLRLRSVLALLCVSACSGRPAPASEDGATASTTGLNPSTGSGDSGDSSESGDSSTESATTEETEASSGASGGFVPDVDESACGQECDTWKADDCPEGLKCTLANCGGPSWDSTVCREIQGDAQVGDECIPADGDPYSGNDTCVEGSLCWSVDDDTGLGYCVPFCQSSDGTLGEDSCPEAYYCAATTWIFICLPSCDPLTQDCPGTNSLCLPAPGGDEYICMLDGSGDMAPYGTPCNYTNSCNAGLVCVDATAVPELACETAAGCCSPMCSISAGLPCPGLGQSCEPVFDPQPPGYEDVGVCMAVG